MKIKILAAFCLTLIAATTQAADGNPIAANLEQQTAYVQKMGQALLRAVGPINYLGLNLDLTVKGNTGKDNLTSLKVNKFESELDDSLNDIILPSPFETGDPQMDRFMPSLKINTKGLRAHFTAKIIGTNQELKANLVFLNSKNAPVAPIAVVGSDAITVFTFEMSSIDFTIDNLFGDSGIMTIAGTCGIRTQSIDSTTNRPTMIPAQCSFTGRYDARSGDYEFHPKFDNMNTQTPAKQIKAKR